MLEHVALNQTGFKIPGVAPDARGVLLGKQGAVLLSSIDRLVSFLRLLSEESSLDDVLPSLKIHQVRTPLESREFLVLLHAQSSYLLDRCARVAALCGGLLCTGSVKHFVKYRDRQSPLGYDTDTLYTEPCDYVLYADAFTQGYTRRKEVPFAQLVLQLSPKAVPGGALRDAREPEGRELLWLTVEKGLSRKLLSYLWRNRVKTSACVVSPGIADAAETSAALLGPGREYLLVRVQDIPERMLLLLCAVPGIEIYRPVGENYVVELGYRHPINLTSCAGVFDKERFYLFRSKFGARDACEVLLAPPPLVPGESLLEAHFEIPDLAGPGSPSRAAERRPRAPEAQQVRLRLCHSTSRQRRVTATLVPWDKVHWFKQLVYVLPPTLLRGYRCAPIDEGIFVVSPQGIDGLPIGGMFHEVAPAIFVPLGMDFLPRVGPEILTEHVGGVTGRYVVFLPGHDAPLGLPHGAFDALGRRALAPLEVTPRQRRADVPRAQAPGEATLVNDPIGALPLWGFRDAGPGKPVP